ncbi:MAG: hypothetical protein IJ679_01555 [Lachnospiraceae bacterium]|nr:hypothetical protein [Lachnospiraceae bacterium]
MITYEDKAFNSWQDVVKDYPAMWVVFDKVDFRKGRVQSGNIWVILPDQDIIKFENEHSGHYALSLRTTETVGVDGNMGGYIHGELIDA